jgi:WD40 repeat protein
MQLSELDWAYVEERAAYFTGRGWVFAHLDQFLAGPPGAYLLLGEPGTGKTAVAAQFALAAVGRLAQPAAGAAPCRPVPASAAYFCRAGGVSLFDAAQRLSDQLAEAVPAFRDARRATLLPEIRIGDVQLHTGDIAPGGSATGIRIDLSRLDAERAFERAVTLPLVRMRESGDTTQVVVLVDALDESLASRAARELPQLLGEIKHVHLVVTARPDRRAIGWLQERAVCVNLISDRPPGSDDVLEYLQHRLAPEGEPTAMATLAKRVAEQAGGNFLYAFHVFQDLRATRTLAAMSDAAARVIPLPQGGLPGVYRDFLRRELWRDDRAWSRWFGPVLAPLAVAQDEGLTTEQIRLVTGRLGGEEMSRTGIREVTRVVRQFLDGPAPDGPFRVYHQSFADFLTDPERNPDFLIDAAEAHEAIVAAYAANDPLSWDIYAQRNLALHASKVGRLDSLLEDARLLLAADLRRLIEVADDASSPSARRQVRLLRLTPQAFTADPASRAALFSVTEALENLGTSYRDDRWQAPYRALWAITQPRGEHVSLKGLKGWARAVCSVMVGDRNFIAASGDDHSVHIWDPRSGEQVTVLEGHQKLVSAICSVSVGGRDLLATASHDGTVRVWDPRSSEQLAVLEGHQDWVSAVCSVCVGGRDLLATGSHGTVRLWDPRSGEQLALVEGRGAALMCSVCVGGRDLLATVSHDGTVRVWDPSTGEQHAAMKTRFDWARAMCKVRIEGRDLLAVGSDKTVPVWDPGTGEQLAVLEGHRDNVEALCALSVDGRNLLATGSKDHTVRLWDPGTGEQLAMVEGYPHWTSAMCSVSVDGRDLLATGDVRTVRVWDSQSSGRLAGVDTDREIRGVCSVLADGRKLLATGSEDHTVRLWDPGTGEQLAVMECYRGWGSSVCSVSVDGRDLLATGSHDDTVVRLWNPSTGEQLGMLEEQRPFWVMCSVSVDGRDLLVTSSYDHTARLWNPGTGKQVAVLKGHQREVRAACSVSVDGRDLLATGSWDATVRLWDPRSGEQLAVLEGHQERVEAVCSVSVNGRNLLATGSYDGTVRLWDPRSGERLAVLEGHQDWVGAVCSVSVGRRDVLASGGNDEIVRLWDPRAGICTAAIPTNHRVAALAAIADSLAIGLDGGLLVIKLSATA